MSARFVLFVFASPAGLRPAGAAPDAVAGTAYMDANANGVRDAGEKGIPGVRVTDGVGFAATGSDGGYSLKLSPDRELPVPGTQAVAICWPEGTWPTSRRWFRLKDMADAGQKVPFPMPHQGVCCGGQVSQDRPPKFRGGVCGVPRDRIPGE